jgi:hypothetical protein
VPLEKVHIYLGAAPETGAANMTPESQDNAANVPIQPPRTFEQPPEVITQFARVDAPDSPQ